MSWRPDNWDNPHKGEPEFVYPRCCVILENEAYETGADAILDALKKQGRYYPRERKHLIDHQPGWVIFIEDKEEVKE